jgi:glycosyltransferase involved in cell wall biosynthesis
MACGLPCIVADHEVAREHYSGGEVVLVRDPNVGDAFAGPVVSLLRDEAERRRVAMETRPWGGHVNEEPSQGSGCSTSCGKTDYSLGNVRGR